MKPNRRRAEAYISRKCGIPRTRLNAELERISSSVSVLNIHANVILGREPIAPILEAIDDIGRLYRETLIRFISPDADITHIG